MVDSLTSLIELDNAPVAPRQNRRGNGSEQLKHVSLRVKRFDSSHSLWRWSLLTGVSETNASQPGQSCQKARGRWPKRECLCTAGLPGLPEEAYQLPRNPRMLVSGITHHLLWCANSKHKTESLQSEHRKGRPWWCKSTSERSALTGSGINRDRRKTYYRGIRCGYPA